ncbi:hypothetical protein [Paenibacillus sp. HJGM_3]|uniref:hypothetical protein n=1 Tax=Paenibacillus sp. HJGM_3 TaxID=3379816 RepID=UPI00385E454C
MPANDTVMRGLHYRTGEPIEIGIREGFITSIEPIPPIEPYGSPLSGIDGRTGSLPWIGPGLIDLQLNGYTGMDFNTLPIPEGMTERMTRALWDEGVTTYYPTVITNSSENITQAVRAIALARDRDPLTQASVHGIHLEGPFISTCTVERTLRLGVLSEEEEVAAAVSRP